MFNDLRSAVRRIEEDIEKLVEEQNRSLRATASRLALLYLQKERMEELLAKAETETVPMPLPAAPASPPPPGRPERAGASSVVLGRAATVIVEALKRAGEAGLSGTELNDAVRDAQMSKDASEKAKTRLKRLGLVRHDELARRWYPLPRAEVGAR